MGRWEAKKRQEEGREAPRFTPPPAQRRTTNRRGRTVGSNPGSRGSGLTWDATGRPYTMIDGRRVYQGEAASRYEETPEAAVDNVENLEGGSHYTGKETQIAGGGRDSAPPRAGADKNAKGTKMGGLSGDLGAFQKVLESRGIGFNFDSGQLPTSSNHLVSFHDVNKNLGSVLDDETSKRMASKINQAHDYYGSGKEVPFKLGDPSIQTGARHIDGDTYEVLAKGIQADKSDADRALPVNRSKTRDPRGGGSRDFVLSDGFGGDDGWGDDDGYGGYTGRDMNARSKAFLEYGGNTAMALRAAEAAQGTIRQNGNTYGKNSEGKWVRLSKDAESALKNDGNLVATANYVTDNTYKAKPSKDLATETLSKHLEVNKQKLSHGEYLDLTNEGPLSNEENVVSFTNGKTFTMEQLNNNEDLWNENY